MISAHRACIYNAIAFLPPSLREGLCLDFTKMLQGGQEKTVELVYVCVSYSAIHKNQ